jgi:hypothetical protein
MAKTEENKRVERKIVEGAKRGLTSGATRANTAGKAYLKTGATMGELLRAYGEAMAPIHQAEYTALTGEQLYPPKLQPAKWNNATQSYEAIDPNQPTISKAPDSYRAGTYEPKVGAQPIISAENVGEFAYDPLNWISGGTTKAAATGAKLIGRGAKAGAKAAARNAAPMIDRILTEKYGFPSLQPGIVKNPGGEWIQLEPHLARYDEMGRPGAYVPDVNKKFQKLLRNYIVNDMGTAQDPIRMSIDRGISHIDVPWATYSMAENDPTRLGMKLPSGRLGATEAGRNWEILSDNTISVMPAHIYRDTPSPYLKDRYPWLKNKPDNTPVFSIQDSPTSFEQHLGFDHILDVLQQKYLNDELTAEQLRNLSMEKAVRITHDANRAAAAAAGEAELKGYAPNLKLPKIKEYPSGHYIAELPDPTSSDEAMAIVNKIGCQGGWCTQHEHAARNYGSGRSKLHTLFDSEGRPHIQFQVDENIPGMLTEEEKAAVQQRLQDFGITGTSQEEREMYKHLFPEKIQRSIEQIKPAENSWSGARSREYLSRNPNYRNELEPIIQDFVQSNKWASVRDLDNAGLISRTESGMRPALEYRSVAQELGVTPEDINDFILSRPESTSPYFSKKEFQDFMKLQDTPPEGMAQGGAVHMSKGGIAKDAIELAKKYLTPLSEKEFYKTYVAQHKDIRNVTPEDRAAAAQAILESGFNKGVNVNALPVDRGGPARNVIDKRYGNKAGDRVYLLPKEGVLEGGNGLVTAEGYKPNPMQMLDISVDREPSYEAYLRNFTKKAEGGPVHMDEGGLWEGYGAPFEKTTEKRQAAYYPQPEQAVHVTPSGIYNEVNTGDVSDKKYLMNTDIDILNKYGFGVTKQGQIVKIPERTYTWSDDGYEYSDTEPARKIKRSDISELRARYATDDGIEYGIARQPTAKGWSGYRRNMKDNSSVGVSVSPYYTGVNYTKNFAEGGEVHPEFNFEQINQYAKGGVVAHNDFNYAEIDALAQGFAKGGPVLSVGRGEKLPVSQGAGLTAKGRAKYNSATGGNLKAPAPHPKSEKDANRRKSFCARMSGMPGPMKDENGNPTRKAASLKRWNC